MIFCFELGHKQQKSKNNFFIDLAKSCYSTKEDEMAGLVLTANEMTGKVVATICYSDCFLQTYRCQV